MSEPQTGPVEHDAEVEPTEVPVPMRGQVGLEFGLAGTLGEVVEAWQMVYMAYRRAELIEPNRLRIHTAPQAVNPDSAVIVGRIGVLPVSTLTAIADGDHTSIYGHGLPLDRVYGPELAALRSEGRVLMEVGLFADRRKQLARTAEALFQLMRYAFHFGQHMGVTDFVIGVHPRHARFYTRSFGFREFGSTRTYPAVNNRPVVLLRGDVREELKRTPLHPALEYFTKNPLSAEMFRDRWGFDPDQVRSSIIDEFIRAAAAHKTLEKAG